MTVPSARKTCDDPNAIASRVSPWLVSLLHPLAMGLVLPVYFGQIEVVGRENLPREGPVILAPTHQSRWDPLLVAYAAGRHVTGRNLRYMVTATEVRGIQGWFVSRLGGFPVNLKRPSVASLRHGIDLLLDDRTLVIFPEGGIFHDRQTHPVKPGIARLALQMEAVRPGTNVPIVPIAIRYSCLPPRWLCGAHVCIGRPVSLSECDRRSNKEAAQSLSASLENSLARLADVGAGTRSA